MRNRTSTLDTVRRIVGRRSRIETTDMWRILEALAHDGLDLANPYIHATETRILPDAAQAWVDHCHGLVCISVDARGRLRDGYVRYDEPGSMHPMQHAELTFVPADIGDSTVTYMRRHADRVLLVRSAPKRSETPAQLLEICECDNGHRWQTDDPQRDVQCPTCGEYWV